MSEGNIWVRPDIQTKRKRNASNREHFEQLVRLSLCKCGNIPTNNPL